MSGPDLPFVSPDSNQIGNFSIGTSQIGTIPALDPWTTILAQYANSPVLTAILLMMFDAIDQTRNLDDLFDKVRNLDTAIGFGLEVWGRIVGVNRVLKVDIGPRYFGFEEAYPDFDPFNTSPFYSGQQLTQNYVIDDDGFRVMILAKAFSNICDGSIKAINRIMVMLFGSFGRCYVVDNQDMTMTFKFEFPLTPLQSAILLNSGVMPRPVGVFGGVESS